MIRTLNIVRVVRLFGLILTGLCFSFNSEAQTKTIDSLQRKLDQTTDMVQRAYILDELAWEFLYIDPDKTIEFAKQSFAIHTDPRYFEQGSRSAIANRGATWTFLANAYNVKGDYENAYKYNIKALGTIDSLDDDKRKSSVLLSLGNTLSAMRQYDRAITAYLQSLELKQKIGDKKGMGNCLQNIGGAYLYLDKNDSAQVFLEQAREISMANNDKKQLIHVEANLGVVYKRQGKWDQAIQSYKNTVAYRKDSGEKYKIIQSLMNLGVLYADIDSLTQSLKALQEAYELVRHSNFDEIHLEVLRTLSTTEHRLKMADSSFAHMSRASRLVEKVFKESSSRSIAEMQSKYDLDKKQKEIELLSREQRIRQIEAERQRQQIHLLNSDKALKELELAANEEKIKSKQEQLELLNTQKILEAKEAKEREARLGAEAEKAELENKRQRIIIVAVIIGLLLSLVSVFFIFRSLQQTRKQRRIIEEQKRHVEEQKELLQEKNKEILDSITYARRLQEAILPSDKLFAELVPEHFVLYLPKDIVAGDFYFLEQEKDVTIIAAADCTGHGVPGAMVSVVCSNALSRVVKEFGETDPGVILDRTRDMVMDTFRRSDKDVKDGMDISICAIRRKNSGFEIKWAGANNPLWYIQSGIMKEIPADKQPIGFTYDAHPFTTHQIDLDSGDSLYLFTDGYADQFGGPKGKKFKYRTLQEYITDRKDLSMGMLKEKLVQNFSDWKGEVEQIDDVTIIGIQLK